MAGCRKFACKIIVAVNIEIIMIFSVLCMVIRLLSIYKIRLPEGVTVCRKPFLCSLTDIYKVQME